MQIHSDVRCTKVRVSCEYLCLSVRCLNALAIQLTLININHSVLILRALKPYSLHCAGLPWQTAGDLREGDSSTAGVPALAIVLLEDSGSLDAVLVIVLSPLVDEGLLTRFDPQAKPGHVLATVIAGTDLRQC